MLRSLPADSAERIRLLAKFVEKDYQKIVRAVEIRREYAAKVAAVENELQNERARLSAEEQEDRADEWLSRRLDAGLYTLQTMDVVLAWLVAEDEGAREQVKSLLGERKEGLEVVRATLKGRISVPRVVGFANRVPDQLESIDTTAEDRDVVFQDMLATLADHLR